MSFDSHLELDDKLYVTDVNEELNSKMLTKLLENFNNKKTLTIKFLINMT